MRGISLKVLTMLTMFYALNSEADTTWVPISVGDIMTFIPFTPNGTFNAPGNTQLNQSGATLTLSWSDIQHASRFEVQAKNAQGVWISLFITEDNFAIMDSRFNGYTEVRIMACSYNSCANTGSWSASVSINNTRTKRTIFIHTDLLGTPVAETDDQGAIL
jgi:hypothetical protein